MQNAQRQTTWALVTILAAGVVATARVQVAAHTGVEMEPLPESCTVKPVEGGGPEDTAWVVFFTDDTVSVEVQWDPDGGDA